MGAQAAAQMGKLLNGKGKVLSLLGDQSTANGRDRTNGFNRYLKAHSPGIQIVESRRSGRRPWQISQVPVFWIEPQRA